METQKDTKNALYTSNANSNCDLASHPLHTGANDPLRTVADFFYNAAHLGPDPCEDDDYDYWYYHDDSNFHFQENFNFNLESECEGTPPCICGQGQTKLTVEVI